jgi:hypothetical protein
LDDPWLLHLFFSGPVLAEIIEELNRCPPSDWRRYQEAVGKAILFSLRGIVDAEYCRSEFPVPCGRVDLAIPIRTELSDCFPLWNRWQHQFDIRSIIVETKSLQKSAATEDFHQALSYLSLAKLGRFGILVSRSGFTKDAISGFCTIARTSRSLVLPFAHEELIELAAASDDGPRRSMEYLRRKETRLLHTSE